MEWLKTAVMCILIYPISCEGTTGMLFKIERGKRAQSNIMATKYAVTEVDCILHCASLNSKICNFKDTTCELLSESEYNNITLFDNSNWTYMCEFFSYFGSSIAFKNYYARRV